MFTEDLKKVLNALPESGHKVITMYAWHKLLKKLNFPEPFINNVEVVQALSEFSLNFLTAIGFSAGVEASKNDTDPTIKLSLVSTSIAFLIPFIFNVFVKIKLTGKRNMFPLFANITTQMVAILAISASFLQGLRVAGSAQSLGVTQEIKNCFLVAMAASYAGSFSGLLTNTFMRRIHELFYRDTGLLRTRENTLVERPNLERIKASIQGYSTTLELQFLIALFVLMIININEGAREGLIERGLGNPFAQNIIIFPLTSLLANVLMYLYNKFLGK
jgi:hypothetical protein